MFLDLKSIPNIGHHLNSYFLKNVSNTINYKGKDCCHLCIYHFMQFLKKRIQTDVVLQKKIVKTVIILFLKGENVSPCWIEQINISYSKFDI
jgi:hypothetical protein